MVNNRNRDRGQGVQHRSFVASLSPEGQINKVIADMNNLQGGYDLRNWSASARKELSAFITITIEIDCADKRVKVAVPKLPLLVASPNLREFMVESPAAKYLHIIHADVSLEAVRIIANWLRRACDSPEFPTMGVPTDLGEALKLRLTAWKLGMDRYVEHIEERYVKGIADRVATLNEIRLVVDNTRAKYTNDAVVVALANRLNYLCLYEKVPPGKVRAIERLLAEEKFDRLRAAVQEDQVAAMAERDKGAEEPLTWVAHIKNRDTYLS